MTNDQLAQRFDVVWNGQAGHHLRPLDTVPQTADRTVLLGERTARQKGATEALRRSLSHEWMTVRQLALLAGFEPHEATNVLWRMAQRGEIERDQLVNGAIYRSKA